MNNIIHQAGKAVIAGYILTVVNILSKLFITPFVIGVIGQSLFGIWLIISEIMAYFRKLEGGLGFALEQRIARTNWTKNQLVINSIFSSGTLILLIMGLFAFFLGSGFWMLFGHHFNISQDITSTVNIVFILSALSMGLGIPLDSISSYLRGIQKQVWAKNLSIVDAVLGALLVIILLNNNLGLLALPLSGLIVLVFRYIISVVIIRRVARNLSLAVMHINKKTVKTLFKVSIYANIIQLSSLIIFGTDSIVIGLFLETKQVTIYILTFQLILTFVGLIHGVSTNLQPGYAELFSKGEGRQLRTLFNNIFLPIMQFSWLSSFVYFFLNKTFIEVWVGKENYGGLLLTIIFSLTAVYTVFRRICYAFLQSTGDIRYVSKWAIIESLINIILSVIFVKTWGIVGVALGTLISGYIVSIATIIPKIAKRNALPIWFFPFTGMIRPIFFSIPVIMALYILDTYNIISKSWPGLLLTLFLCGLIGLPSIWFSMNKKIRIKLKGKFMNRTL